MKNLFINTGDTLYADSFPEGQFRCRKITGEETGKLIQDTQKAGQTVRACYEFGSVPDRATKRHFHELIKVMTAQTKCDIDPDIFFVTESDGKTFPVISFMSAIDRDWNLLSIQYFFELKDKNLRDLDEGDMGFTVSNSRLKFTLFEFVDNKP